MTSQSEKKNLLDREIENQTHAYLDVIMFAQCPSFFHTGQADDLSL